MSTMRRWLPGSIMVSVHYYGECAGRFVVSVRDDALVFWPAPDRPTDLLVVEVASLAALGFA